MASKKSSGSARGAALVKQAIEAAANVVATPEPVPPGILKKLRMPDEERLSPGLKAWLAFDASLLGWEFDDEEPEFEPMSLAELVEEAFGEEHVGAFGEACELLDGDCLLFEGEGETRSFLYVGTPDDLGEYPVVTLHHGATAKVSGFVPFDVWIAQRVGALPRGDEPGWVPEAYVAAAQALADANAEGRRSFDSEHRDVEAGGDDEDDDQDEEQA